MPLLFVVLGVLYANLTEWVLHKYVLHGLGKKKGAFFAYHWHEHHRNSRKHHMVDASYMQLFTHVSRLKEFVSVILLLLAHAPLLAVAPVFVWTIWIYGSTYLWAHRRSHLDTTWGKKWMPWHYDHHLGRDQDQNWGVLLPIVDWILGTRKKY